MCKARSTKWLAALIAANLAILSPARAVQLTAALSGTIREAPGGAPLPGARLLIAERATGRIIPSERVSSEGAFSMRGLAPGTYDAAVEVAPAVYPLAAPLELASDATRVVRIEIHPSANGAQTQAQTSGKGGGVWNNAFSASLIVLGAALVVTVLVESLTDEDLASPEE